MEDEKRSKIEGIFRKTDIRGVYGDSLDEETARGIGKSFGTLIGEDKTIIVARDNRDSSPSLKEAVVEGILSTGVNIIDIGRVPVPVMYFLVVHKKLDGGVMVTASHNPPEWNGFKLVTENSNLISSAYKMDEIKEMFFADDFKEMEKGIFKEDDSMVQEYLDYVKGRVNMRKGLKVVVDPSNGAACGIFRRLYESVGCEVFEINADISQPVSRDFNPIDASLGKLKEEVKKTGADIGIAFDGDADRVGFVDDKGRYFGNGNSSIMALSEDYIKNGGEKIVIDICCSSVAEDFIKLKGGIPLLNKVGHGFIVDRMRKEGAVFGAEISNHLYFSEVYGMDDGMFAGLKMLELMSKKNMKLSDISDSIEKRPSTEIYEIPCDDSVKFEIVEEVKKKFRSSGFRIVDIDGVKAYNEDGWVLMRASNTLPQVKVNSEAGTMEKAVEMQEKGIRMVLEEMRE